MKKYFVIAALLGVFAFASVSLLAHAEHTGSGAKLAAAVTDKDSSGPAEDGDASDGEAASDEAAAEDDGGGFDTGEATGARSKMDAYDDMVEQCTTSSQEIKGRNGAEPTEKETKAAYASCMKAAGFNKYLIDKMEKEKEKEQ